MSMIFTSDILHQHDVTACNRPVNRLPIRWFIGMPTRMYQFFHEAAK